MIEVCKFCGGLYTTTHESFAGTPCRCSEKRRWMSDHIISTGCGEVEAEEAWEHHCLKINRKRTKP